MISGTHPTLVENFASAEAGLFAAFRRSSTAQCARFSGGNEPWTSACGRDGCAESAVPERFRRAARSRKEHRGDNGAADTYVRVAAFTAVPCCSGGLEDLSLGTNRLVVADADLGLEHLLRERRNVG